MMFRPYARQQINHKTENVQSKNERDDPFNDGGGIAVADFGEDAEGDGEGDFGEDEEELYPEGEAEDTVVAVVNSETLVFGADEDG
jgi:hypothetical protein